MPIVVIARDALDQYVCKQPSSTPQLTEPCGVPSP
jgi:hypothetical protein